MVRDGSMAFGETKGPHVIFHLFMSFLFSFFSSSFVMVLMWSAFMLAPQGHNRTEPLQPRQLYPFYPSIHHSPLSIPPSSLSTPFCSPPFETSPWSTTRLNKFHMYCPAAQNDTPWVDVCRGLIGLSVNTNYSTICWEFWLPQFTLQSFFKQQHIRLAHTYCYISALNHLLSVVQIPWF